MSQQQINKALGFANVATGFLALFLLVASIKEAVSIFHLGDSRPVNTVTVSGTGNAYAIPDVATFSFTVTDTEKTVADAQAKATAEASSALAVVSAAGVADKDIQTTSYSISPHYEYQNAVCPTYAAAGSVSASSGAMIPATPIYCPAGKQTLTGYDVSESVSVKLRDLSKAGDLLAALGSAGVENLNGPSFDVDNPDTVQASARAAAIADAQSQAASLAKELGVSLGGITNFSENNGNYLQPVAFAMNASVGASAPAAAPAVPAGQQEVTDNVTITYQIR